MMYDDIQIKINLNVKREESKELWEEIENTLFLYVNYVLENHKRSPYSEAELLGRSTDPDRLSSVINAKLDGSYVKVTYTDIVRDPATFGEVFRVSMTVPNIWAMKYGKEENRQDFELRLELAFDFLDNPSPAKPSKPLPTSTASSSTPLGTQIGGTYGVNGRTNKWGALQALTGSEKYKFCKDLFDDSSFFDSPLQPRYDPIYGWKDKAVEDAVKESIIEHLMPRISDISNPTIGQVQTDSYGVTKIYTLGGWIPLVP